MKNPCVYLLASHRNGTLYVGVTSNLPQRILQHRSKSIAGFTAKHNVVQLVWYEVHESMLTALARQRALKEWKREWKLKLIEKNNPYWVDLFPEIS